jgi:hypothetical protein
MLAAMVTFFNGAEGMTGIKVELQRPQLLKVVSTSLHMDTLL